MQLSDDSGSLPGESPYIGKGRFHENEYAVERRVYAKPKKVRYADVNGSTSTFAVSDLCASMCQGQLDSVDVDRDKQQQIDTELQEKLRALSEGRV